MKRILDSVHGHISISNHYFKGIIDTPYFQRLRQIEQTSTRSIFPSARHDRFIHSLGVFHIGNMICCHIEKEFKSNKNSYEGITNARFASITESYRLACLLHDISHAPFSHTFEEYFGIKNNLGDTLISILNSKAFNEDLTPIKRNPAEHEYASAILCSNYFNERIQTLKGDVELVARMIIGCRYSDDNKSLENCFIDLIHGDIIDADRLDYACRDVWASGYSTSTIDLTRLISSIHIKYKHDEKKYVVCYDVNGINEIESVMQVKDFQTQYTINHHKVKLEQWLLIHAAQCLALKYFPHAEEKNEEDKGTKALLDFFDLKSMTEVVKLTGDDDSDILYRMTDGDLLYLMKKQGQKNPFYLQWSSRQYEWVPIWKTPTEFAHLFSLEARKSIPTQQFRDVVGRVMESLEIEEYEYIILPTSYKSKVTLEEVFSA